MDPQRTLVGATADQLKRIESALPQGAQIARYPLSQTSESAAIATADLDQDGLIETVAVYSIKQTGNAAETPSLYLGVLGSEQKRLKLRAIAGLAGNYIQNHVLNEKVGPFAVRNVTKRGKEILVT